MTSWSAAFAEAVLPDYPPLAPRNRAEVEGRVAAFLDHQPRLAPTHVRFGLCFLGCGFRLASFVRAGRGFAALDLAPRRAAIDWWEHLSGPTRSFIRFYRSLALLAFFEDSVVLSALGCPDRHDWRENKQRERATRMSEQ